MESLISSHEVLFESKSYFISRCIERAKKKIYFSIGYQINKIVGNSYIRGNTSLMFFFLKNGFLSIY